MLQLSLYKILSKNSEQWSNCPYAMIFPVNDFKRIALDSSLASFHLKVENNVYIRAFSMLNKEA